MTCPNGSLARDVLRISGEERVGFLQGLLTQDIEGLAPGSLAFGALLSPQGKIVETMVISGTEDAVFLDVPAGRGAGLRKKLMLYKLRAKVGIDEVSGDVRVVVGPDRAGLGEAPLAAGPDPRLAEIGMRTITAQDPGADVDGAYHDHLLRLGVPQMGVDFGEAEVFALDVNLDALGGIEHHKGCFVGQEVASRMYRKGSIRKRTYRVEGASLEAGAAIMSGSKQVGTVTSARDGLGLAIMRVDRLGPSAAELTVNGAAVRAEPPAYLDRAEGPDAGS